MNPLLSAHHVSFAYTERPVLQDVTLALSPGEILTLIGPNGSGKSTLLRALLGHLHARGEIQWENRPLLTWKRRDLARRVAYLPQSPTYDIDHRVIDVLRLGRAPYWSAFGLESTHDAQVIDRVARDLALTDLLPARMDELSGGQRQRVFIGRCLVQEPVALVLDEPNTYLDIRHQVELSTLLHALARTQNVAILMASHDLNLAALTADRLLLLDAGRVRAEGSPTEVLTPDLLTSAYGIHIQRIDRGPNTPPIVIPVF
jgi:iron complex transport system ATP-binding protein